MDNQQFITLILAAVGFVVGLLIGRLSKEKEDSNVPQEIFQVDICNIRKQVSTIENQVSVILKKLDETFVFKKKEEPIKKKEEVKKKK